MFKDRMKVLAKRFDIPGDFLFADPYGSGHINDTYAVSFTQGGANIRYIFQRINHNVFKKPTQVMENILRVTEHQQRNLAVCPDETRRALRVIRARDSKPYLQDEDGNYWRVYIFVENAHTYDVIEKPEQAYQAAKAFGQFQSELVDLPGGRLHETIPDFHNTPSRFEKFVKALEADAHNRAASVKAEIDFALARQKDASVLLDLCAKGEIPERITHNDTKLNNVLIDDLTGEGICVIDLDTVMPGLALYDFGDLVRTSTSPAKEDETDLSKVRMQFPMFEQLVNGYLATAGKFLTKAELEHLPFSGKLITFEIGLRFLTDHLEGDTYFKTHRANHNRDRCRTQFKLVESIEEQLDKMLQFTLAAK